MLSTDGFATSARQLELIRQFSKPKNSFTFSAAKNNLPLADILKMGDWSSPSTFQKFYYKPIIGSTYARSVLNKTINLKHLVNMVS